MNLSNKFSTQQYQSAEEKDRISVPKRSPASDREIMSREQVYNRSRYPEPAQRERNLGDSRHGQTPPPRYERERNEEQQPVQYSRSEIQTRRDMTLPAREVRPAYDATSRDIRALRDALASRDLRSLRDIVPPRDALPSRGTNPPREAMPQRERSARDMPQRDSFASRDLRREATLPRETIPSRDPLLPRAALLPPRDARSAREPMSNSYDREMGTAHRDVGALRRERDPLPPRYKPTDMTPARVSHEALDRARYERVAAERFEREKDYPRHEREPIESRFARNGAPWESGMGASRGSHPSHYPIEGPMIKRPRY